MNPLTGSLKFLSSTLFNSLLAFLFFLIAGHFTSPEFVGKVAIIQLMETIAGTFFMLLPENPKKLFIVFYINYYYKKCRV
ncbi:hypothetical protein YN1_7350 [Nanoarchaeota archaeon]